MEVDLVKGIQDRITLMLAEHGMTYREASLKAGLGETFVRDVMNGKSKDPGSRKLERLSEALGCSYDWLVNGREAP